MAEDWKTIRVPVDVYNDAKERKEEHGVTWGQYVNPHAWHSVFDEPTEGVGGDIASVLEPTQDDIQTIIKKLDQIQGAQGDTVSQALEIGEHGVYEMHEEMQELKEELQGGQTVDLEATTINQIAEEIERRLGR